MPEKQLEQQLQPPQQQNQQPGIETEMTPIFHLIAQFFPNQCSS